MASEIKSKAVTFKEFCVVVKEDQKADLIDGVIYMASPENTDANELFVWLLHILGGFVEARDLGKVYGSRVAFRLDDENSPEPDIAFVRKDRLHLVQRGYVDGPPDLAIEIVSPESIDRDYETKKMKYQEAGVHEYWIIDDATEKVLLWRLNREKEYRAVRPRGGAYHSQVLTDFWFRPEWLWQQPRPKKADVLQMILDS
jgi:Uma2 family endonuclease